MSGGKYDQVLEDKYAARSANFKNEPAIPVQSKNGPINSLDQFQTLQKDVLTSDVEKQKQLAALNKPKGLIQRKMERIFGAVGDVKTMFLQGFKMGFIVGGIFGGCMGTYYAVVYRQLMYIPMSAIGSGGSFGFFMGIGMIMRSEMEGLPDEEKQSKESVQQENDQYQITQFNPQTRQIEIIPMYKRGYQNII